MTGVSFSAVGTALPDKIVTNADFAARLDTSDQWITERTGIKERHMGGTTVELGIQAGKKALEVANLDPSEIGLCILTTTAADHIFPGSSHGIQTGLGLNCGAFDLNAACSGFVYSLVVGHGLVRGSGVDKILLIASEALSRFVDQDDRSTAVLFGDGAGAIVLQKTNEPDSLLSWDLGSSGQDVNLLYCDHSGFLQMKGRDVFKKAVRVVVDSVQKTLQRANLDVKDIDLFVPHQANIRIIEAINQRLGIPMEKTAIVLDKLGNTSAASIPLALDEATKRGNLKKGDTIVVSGFGAGMSWASAALKWG